MPTTPAKKVRAYRVFVQGFRITAIILAILAAFAMFFIHALLAIVLFIGAILLFTTSFVSSKPKFAKEVEVKVILHYCREKKCGFVAYPTTVAECDALREDTSIFDELTSLATAVIKAEADVYKYRRNENSPAPRAAEVNEHNARRAFKVRWDFYRCVGPAGILPYRDRARRTQWKDEAAFLESVALATLSAQRQKTYA
jgi:hypothetical protein